MRKETKRKVSMAKRTVTPRGAPPEPPFAKRASTVITQRAALKISRKRLATLTNISYPVISKLEKGEEDVSDDVLAAVAAALRIDFHVLRFAPDSKASVAVNLYVDRLFQELAKEPAVDELLASATRVINAISELRRQYIARGSTIVVVDMYYEDIQRLCFAFIHGLLKPLKITSISIFPEQYSYLSIRMFRLYNSLVEREHFFPEDAAYEVADYDELLRDSADYINVFDRAYDMYMAYNQETFRQAWNIVLNLKKEELKSAEQAKADSERSTKHKHSPQ
jgi:transcriptional regulator with XRE-family HTH domain